MADDFEDYPIGLNSPAYTSQVITDFAADTELGHISRGLWIEPAASGTNQLVIRLARDSGDITLTITNSILLPLRASHIRSATTVAKVIALF